VQAQFQAAGHVDLDGDGVGEYGTFGELTAASGLRGSPDGGLRTKPLGVPVLSPALANVDHAGFVTKSGFAFRIFLPGRSATAVREGTAGGACDPFSGTVDVDAAEVRWCAYAWPVSFKNSGTRCFYVDETGTVLQCANPAGAYDGLLKPPSFDAAFPAGVLGNWALVPTGPGPFTGRDGNTWTPCN